MIQRRIAAGMWDCPEATVLRYTGATVDWRHRLLVAALATGGTVSHESAAELHGIEYVPRGRVVVTVPPDGNRRVQATVHESNDLSSRWRACVDPIPVTTPARTIVDLAGVLGRRQLEHALDHALGRRVVSIGEVVDAFDALARRGRRGVASLRPVLAARASGYVADTTELERKFTLLVRRAGLPEPDRQVLLGRERLIGQVDFVYRRHALIVEVDGRLGHEQLLDFEKDRRRDQEALVMGFRVVRFTYHQVTRCPGEVESVLAALLAP